MLSTSMLCRRKMRQLSTWIHGSDLNVSDLVIETWQTVSPSPFSPPSHMAKYKQRSDYSGYLPCLSHVSVFTVEVPFFTKLF